MAGLKKQFSATHLRSVLLLAIAAAFFVNFGSAHAQTDASDVARFTIEAQPLERWIRLGATLLRDSGARTEADELALKTRFIAAAIKVDTDRHAVVRGELTPDSDGELELVPASLSALLPTPLEETQLQLERIEFGDKFGVRQVEDDGSPLNDGEFYATVADRWAWIAKAKAAAGANAHVSAREEFPDSPDSLVRLIVADPITGPQQAEMIAKLWQDVERDLVRKGDEPDNVYALRSEIQTALARLIESAVTDFESIQLEVDAADSFDLNGRLVAAWSDDGTWGSGMSQMQAVSTQFGDLLTAPYVIRLQSCFRMPSRTARRLARWADTLGDVSLSVAELANRPKLMPLISTAQRSLAPAISATAFDAFVDVVSIENRLAIEGAVAYPGDEILLVAEDLMAGKSDRIVRYGRWTFLQVGDRGKAADSPFGPAPALWVTADENAVYFYVGQPEGIDHFATRLSSTRGTASVSVASTPNAATSDRAVRQGVPDTSGGQPIARLDINVLNAIESLQAFEDSEGAQRLTKAFTKSEVSSSAVSSLVLGTLDGGLVLTANVPGDVVVAITSAFVEAKKKR